MNTNNSQAKESVLQRIRKIIEFYSISDRRFAEAINLPQTTISSLFNRGNEPNVSIIQSILSVYTVVSPEWLLTGQGSMFKTDIVTDKSQIINTDIWERFEELAIKRFPNYVENLQVMSKELNMNKSRLKEILIDGAFLSYSEIINLSYSGINIDWLITGKGSMLKSETQTSTITERSNKDNTVNYKLVPLLNLDAVGGMHSLNSESGDSEYIDKLIPFTDAQDGDVALIISGESMSPTCPSGSKVLIREVPRWNEYFGYGNLFVLLLTDGRRILKEVQKWQEDPKNFVLCRSHNDKYPEEELPKSMIAGVWKVVKILNERGW